MSGAMERVLRLVAEGKLSAEDAAPILDALSARDAVRGSGGAAGEGAADAAVPTPGPGPGSGDGTGAKFARIMVMEGGRRVVDLRVPTSLGRLALGKIPGLSAEQLTELQQAISVGRTGPLLEIEDPDGDGVKIVLE